MWICTLMFKSGRPERSRPLPFIFPESPPDESSEGGSSSVFFGWRAGWFAVLVGRGDVGLTACLGLSLALTPLATRMYVEALFCAAPPPSPCATNHRTILSRSRRSTGARSRNSCGYAVSRISCITPFIAILPPLLCKITRRSVFIEQAKARQFFKILFCGGLLYSQLDGQYVVVYLAARRVV